MKKLTYVIAVMALLTTFVACEKNELNVPETVKEANETNILSFANEAEFQALVANIRKGEADPSSKLRSASTTESSGFVSLFDEYEQAMEEADDYYQREGGYEEFKQKFPNLYYPEYKDDYSAYLPVSDEAVAKLLNKEGDVIVAGEVKNMIDIFSYQQLEELELTYPESTNSSRMNTRSSIVDNVEYVRLEETIYNSDNNRKFFIRVKTADIIPNDTYYFVRVESQIIFRKKGFLGAWYNYSSDGFIALGVKKQTDPVPAIGQPSTGYDSGASPLNFVYTDRVPFIFGAGAPTVFLQSAWYRGYGAWVVCNSLEK